MSAGGRPALGARVCVCGRECEGSRRERGGLGAASSGAQRAWRCGRDNRGMLLLV